MNQAPDRVNDNASKLRHVPHVAKTAKETLVTEKIDPTEKQVRTSTRKELSALFSNRKQQICDP